jgi:hypothetical protein
MLFAAVTNSRQIVHSAFPRRYAQISSTKLIGTSVDAYLIVALPMRRLAPWPPASYSDWRERQRRPTPAEKTSTRVRIERKETAMSDRSQVSIDTVAAVANQMTEWLDRETCDGLIVAPDTVPEAFV